MSAAKFSRTLDVTPNNEIRIPIVPASLLRAENSLPLKIFQSGISRGELNALHSHMTGIFRVVPPGIGWGKDAVTSTSSPRRISRVHISWYPNQRSYSAVTTSRRRPRFCGLEERRWSVMRPFSVGSKQYRKRSIPRRHSTEDNDSFGMPPVFRQFPLTLTFYSISGGMGLTLSWRAFAPKSPGLEPCGLG